MSAADPRRVEEVFDGALGLAEDAVGPYLDAACGADSALRHEVLALLEADRRAGERAPERIAARAIVADAVASTMPDASSCDLDPARRTAPRTIGPFEIVRALGEGGMGVVYEAYDARLDRRVAVKLVRLARGGSTDVGKARLLVEARALARVTHPNVVAIHEVGVVDADVFIVMELVEGETLAAWLRREPRSWRDVLAKYASAGRGLAAAHAAGIVHRDFKPDNVLVGKDGRPRVADFGLARAEIAASERKRSGPRPSGTAIDHTFAGAIVGTPAYMSPEHFRGEAIDPRSDQFSFAVALHRALFGVAPFEGKTFDELRKAVLDGTPSATPPASDVPAAVTEAIHRALSLDPDARYPSMNELLAVIDAELALASNDERDPSRSRNKRRVAAVVLIVVAALTAIPVGDGPPVASSAEGLLVLGFVALGTLLVLGLVFRRMLLESAYNRRVAALFALPVLGFIVHRALAIRLGSRVEDILVGDAIAMAVLLAFAGLQIERWMAIGAVLAVGYAGLATLCPAWAAPGFASLLCLLAAVPVIYWRTPRPRRRGGGTTDRSGTGKKILSGVGSGGAPAD